MKYFLLIILLSSTFASANDWSIFLGPKQSKALAMTFSREEMHRLFDCQYKNDESHCFFLMDKARHYYNAEVDRRMGLIQLSFEGNKAKKLFKSLSAEKRNGSLYIHFQQYMDKRRSSVYTLSINESDSYKQFVLSCDDKLSYEVFDLFWKDIYRCFIQLTHG